MSNSWFKFKQFIIHQENVAMKVCTDACLFGAWVAEKIQTEKVNVERVLDIGTGTGLLSLMLAQKLHAIAHGVEIDVVAAQQAQQNFEQSPYKERLRLIQGDIRTYDSAPVYNLVISNPPFYQDDLKSVDVKRNVALHSQLLSFEELIIAAKKALAPQGIFAVLLPFFRSSMFKVLAQKHDLFLRDHVLVSQTEKHQPFRSMMLFSTFSTTMTNTQMIIKRDGKYSFEFIELLKDYYMFL